MLRGSPGPSEHGLGMGLQEVKRGHDRTTVQGWYYLLPRRALLWGSLVGWFLDEVHFYAPYLCGSLLCTWRPALLFSS